MLWLPNFFTIMEFYKEIIGKDYKSLIIIYECQLVQGATFQVYQLAPANLINLCGASGQLLNISNTAILNA